MEVSLRTMRARTCERLVQFWHPASVRPASFVKLRMSSRVQLRHEERRLKLPLAIRQDPLLDIRARFGGRMPEAGCRS